MEKEKKKFRVASHAKNFLYVWSMLWTLVCQKTQQNEEGKHLTNGRPNFGLIVQKNQIVSHMKVANCRLQQQMMRLVASTTVSDEAQATTDVSTAIDQLLPAFWQYYVMVGNRNNNNPTNTKKNKNQAKQSHIRIYRRTYDAINEEFVERWYHYGTMRLLHEKSYNFMLNIPSREEIDTMDRKKN